MGLRPRGSLTASQLPSFFLVPNPKDPEVYSTVD